MNTDTCRQTACAGCCCLLAFAALVTNGDSCIISGSTNRYSSAEAHGTPRSLDSACAVWDWKNLDPAHPFDSVAFDAGFGEPLPGFHSDRTPGAILIVR